MRKSIILQLFLVFMFLVSFETVSYGKESFTDYYNKAIELYKQGKYDQAGKKFKQAIELKPSDVYALYGLGNTYYCKALYDDAVTTYSKAIEINPDYAKVHYSLSLAYSKLGKTSEAEKEKDIFRKLSKGDKGGKKASSTQAKLPATSKKKTAVKTDVGVKRLDKKEASRVLTEKPARKPLKNAFKEIQRTPAKKGSSGTEESQTIFKGYTQEPFKAKPRVFSREKYKKYIPKINLIAYVKAKWENSIRNKVFICTAGYILAIQMWLCAVTFIGVIAWNIRKKVE